MADQIDSSKKRTLGFMRSQELEWKLQSKADFYQYLDKHLQYYMPPANHVNKDFLKQVFAEEKKLIKKIKVNHVEVPYYE